MTERIEVTPWFYILAAGGVLLLPWNVLIAAVLAVLIHELSHLLMLRCFRIPVYQIRIGAIGIKIVTGPMGPYKEALCAAAGPLGSLALLLLRQHVPFLALFGTVQGLFNLLPVYPLDGGRVLRALLSGMFPESCMKYERLISFFVICAIFILISKYISVELVCTGVIFLLLSYLIRKIPCKESAERVQ